MTPSEKDSIIEEYEGLSIGFESEEELYFPPQYIFLGRNDSASTTQASRWGDIECTTCVFAGLCESGCILKSHTEKANEVYEEVDSATPWLVPGGTAAESR